MVCSPLCRLGKTKPILTAQDHSQPLLLWVIRRGQQDDIAFNDARAGKWFLTKGGGNNFFLWDNVGLKSYLLATTGSSLTLGPAQTMVVTQGASVGIQTVSPAYPLDVVGDMRTSTCLHYSNDSIGTCSLTSKSNGT
jgi:hypothetical protein